MPSRPGRTYERALRLLEFRARSVAELRRSLVRKGEPVADVEAAIRRLLAQRLLDDAEFARQFARAKVTGAGASRYRVVQELARRGIPRALAESAVDALRDEEGLDAAATIRQVADRKWRTLVRLDPVTGRRRLYAFLARRGYNPEEIRNAMRALLARAT
jgi:regulatory protein